ncbi:CdaR family transcriptional regulator [Brevibacterium aurantiacum]|uniref:helix-turn-helix domain-containing protein n=1 Tax=Brevibacterium aurantiacum TaxID=273384 RepID=UPI000F64834F|nr:helix-turn-helix domain-containing protein [Brevibacterium aurantiacum]AZL11619.1 CdaR family transcriptional regulator [Brevibacterium aurantiacum]
MQELLGRIANLDPQASLGLRVIACFDELMVGEVNSRALAAAAAALAGCPAGFRNGDRSRQLRIDPSGSPGAGARPAEVSALVLPDASEVWLEREGQALPNDDLILERFGLAIGVRFGFERQQLETPRDVALALDTTAPTEERVAAAVRLGLVAGHGYRVLVAPLFAVFDRRPAGPTDVVASEYGALQVLIVADQAENIAVTPAGLGPVGLIGDLPRSLRAAVVALRLSRPPEEGLVRAENFGGLVELLAESPDAVDPDAARIDEIMEAPWAESTVRVVLEAPTIRQAARDLGLHHSTVQGRVEQLARWLGYDPLTGYNRTRLGISVLRWRLRNSHVLELPGPVG